MTITNAAIMREPMSGSFPFKYSERQIKISWKITSNSINDGPLYVEENAPIASGSPPPARGGSYSWGNEPANYLICTNVDIQRAEHSETSDEYYWIWTGTFQEYGLAISGAHYPNPTSRPSRYWFETLTRTRAADKHYVSGVATSAVNSAGQPFDPPHEIDQHFVVHCIQRNEAGPYGTIVGNANTYVGKINSTNFSIGTSPNNYTIVARKGLMLPMVVSVQQNENNVPFWEVAYRIAENPNEWKETPLDHGKMYLHPTDGLLPFLDKNKEIKFEGGNLDGSTGNKLADGTPGVFLDGQGGRDGPFYFFEQADFSSLSL